MTTGIPAQDLSDDDLRRELHQLEIKRGDIESEGTADQKANHAARSAELDAEATRRFGNRPGG